MVGDSLLILESPTIGQSGLSISMLFIDSAWPPGEGGRPGSEAPCVTSPGSLSGGGDSGELSALKAAGAHVDGNGTAKKSTVWITVAVVIAVAALLIVGILLFCHHRRRATQAQTAATEAGCEIPVDIETSLENLDGFLSEQNALSHDRSFSPSKRLNGEMDDSFLLTKTKLGDLLE
jgi:hypothetical protein